jgi:hypothetical protein
MALYSMFGWPERDPLTRMNATLEATPGPLPKRVNVAVLLMTQPLLSLELLALAVPTAVFSFCILEAISHAVYSADMAPYPTGPISEISSASDLQSFSDALITNPWTKNALSSISK